MKIVAIILLVLFTGCSTSSSYSDNSDRDEILKGMGYSGRHDEILKSMGY